MVSNFCLVARKGLEGFSIAGGASALLFDLFLVFTDVLPIIKWILTGIIALIGAAVGARYEQLAQIEREKEQQALATERRKLIAMITQTQMGVKKLNEKLRTWRRQKLVVAAPERGKDSVADLPQSSFERELDELGQLTVKAVQLVGLTVPATPPTPATTAAPSDYGATRAALSSEDQLLAAQLERDIFIENLTDVVERDVDP